MRSEKNGALNGVMYALYHLNDLDDARANKYMYNIYDNFTKLYSRELQEQTVASIERALEHGDIDAFCTLPNLPRSNEFRKEYLRIVLAHLKLAMA